MIRQLIIIFIVVIILTSGFYVYKNSHRSALLSGEFRHPRSTSAPNPTSLPLNLDSIFTSDHSWTENLDPEKTMTLIATGDIIPARVVNFQSVSRNDFSWSYKNIADLTKSADLTFINLETPLIKGCKPTVEGMSFCGDVRHLQGLLMLGADVANLGNNHAGNYGLEGVEQTSDLLVKNNIQVVGTNSNRLVYHTIKGIKFVFLGYNDITNPQPGVLSTEDDQICSDIKNIRKNVDLIIVTYHWGVEYQAQPDDRQKLLGHLTIDCGADLVIGNHPHWIQPIEFYKDRLITYAHGNTIFDQMWSEETKYGVIGEYTFFDKKLVDVEYFPLYIKDFGQPTLLEDTAKQKVLDNMKNQSEILASSSAIYQ